MGDKSLPTWYLMELLKMTIKGNIFEFGGSLYKQVIGTAMGTRVAPTYACLFMADLEENKLLPNWTGTQPHFWRRFIDDVLFFWRGTEEELLLFIDHLNSQHSHIRFEATYNVSTKSVPFLDMVVSVDDNGMIQTDLYQKSTSVIQYLLPTSCHPAHVCRNIPFSLGYRLLRLCSKPEDLGIRLDQLKEALLSRGYNPKVISGAFTKVKAITRKDALKKVEKTQRSRMVPLVITYHPTLPSIAQIVRKHWSVMIQDDFRLEKCFPAPPVVAYRRSKNLKDLLIRAKLPIGKRSGRKKGGFTKCGGFCNVCTFNESTSSHKNSKTGEVWKINTELSCKSQDVVYKIRCGKCSPFAYSRFLPKWIFFSPKWITCFLQTD